MRFNPIEFFYELFNGNPYVVTVMILSVIIALIPDSLVYFIKDIPSKIKNIFKSKPANSSASATYDFVPADNNYFTFKGRLSRSSYIKRTLLAYVGVVAVVLFCCWLAGSTAKIEQGSAYTILMFVLIIPLAIVIYASMNRRFHDIGKSSKWTLAMFLASNTLTIVYFLAILYLFYKKGVDGPNEYGPDPLQ